MLRYAAFLQRELESRGHTVRLVLPRVVLRGLVGEDHWLGKWLGYLDKYVFFRIGFSRLLKNADLVHVCDHSNSPYLGWIGKVPKIITGHDALAIRSGLGHYPENPTRASGRRLQQWILDCLPRADHIIYISDKTRDDFTNELSISVPSNVILHSLNWSYEPASVQQMERAFQPLGIVRGQYLFHVGGNQWYKNRLGVLRAFTEIKKQARFRDLKLVMAGKPFTTEIRDWVQRNSLPDVLELAEISNEMLQCLYSGALAMLFPSLQEGFGWPLLEAQATGCPVITSNRPPMTQVAGNGAVYFDPDQPALAVSALDEVMARREELIAWGKENLKRFTTEEMISRYEWVYQDVLDRVSKTR